MTTENKPQLSCCCISHAFHQAASLNPTKIAIINASKRPKTLLDHEANNKTFKAHNFNQQLQPKTPSNDTLINPNPPLYDKDKFFTFSQMLSAVDSLSFKLTHIINGGDDPFLIKPTSGNHSFSKLNVKLMGVYMVPSVEYVITVLSVLRIGAAFFPLDPFWPKERVLSVISSSNVDLIIGCLNSEQFDNAHLVNKSHWLLNCGKVPVLCMSVDGIFEQKCEECDLNWPCESRDLRKFSYLMYTSGSTGKPKGVCGTEAGVLNRFLWMQELYPLSEDDVLLFKTSVSFVDHLQEFLAPMLAGCTLVVPPFGGLKGNLFGYVDFLYNYSITRMIAVPSLMRVILPALEERYTEGISCSLKILVLSGEVFPLSLWKVISRILPQTCVLNIYGSTEVSADCTYFDCRCLPSVLEFEMLTSVPIGKPISNCNVKVFEGVAESDEGELCVAGICVSSGYYSEGDIMPLECVQLTEGSVAVDDHPIGSLYYRTGDFARRLPGGDLVFLARKDRTIKINGHRVALEEVEETLRGHSDIADVAVVVLKEQEEHAFLGAILVLNNTNKSSEVLESLKSWMAERLPSAMIPKEITFAEAIPITSTGKIDYKSLSSSFIQYPGPISDSSKALEQIKEVFCNALSLAEVGNNDDFFVLGGDSLIAAHVAHKLGIDMRLLYMYPSPSQLHNVVMEKKESHQIDYQLKWETLPKAQKEDLAHSFQPKTLDFDVSRKRSSTILANSDEHRNSKNLKLDTDSSSEQKAACSVSFVQWESHLVPSVCALSRCNKNLHKSRTESSNHLVECQEVEFPENSIGSLRELWKVPMDSCVDASPLIVLKNEEKLVFIGSHSHKFVCINAKDGLVRWERKLEGRIECTAVVDGDFSQVIVGCYQGKIYFFDMLEGTINWTFQTSGEVKSQPAVDRCRHLIWCGSHDHNLYGLDYKNHCCAHQFACGGSIFGSPAIDEGRDVLYVGTTNGHLIAIMLKASSISTVWLLELKAPIFGSLSICSNGNVICCLVSGEVLSVNPEGSIVWKAKTNGPIFAGPCVSMALGSQALVCSRDGIVYSFELENGSVSWEYNVGDPITSSAYVDDTIKLISDSSSPSPSQRLVCVCSSSGRISLLLASCITGEANMPENVVKKFAEMNLEGDIFSSPVMVGGRIFVGCRDDNLHCLVAESLVENN